MPSAGASETHQRPARRQAAPRRSWIARRWRIACQRQNARRRGDLVLAARLSAPRSRATNSDTWAGTGAELPGPVSRHATSDTGRHTGVTTANAGGMRCAGPMIDPRIERLRRLIAQLEQAPPSFRRDALVRAIRQRVATLE